MAESLHREPVWCIDLLTSIVNCTEVCDIINCTSARRNCMMKNIKIHNSNCICLQYKQNREEKRMNLVEKLEAISRTSTLKKLPTGSANDFEELWTKIIEPNLPAVSVVKKIGRAHG